MNILLEKKLITYYKLISLRSPGGDEGIRTPGLRLAKAALSQLSYIPVPIGSGMKDDEGILLVSCLPSAFKLHPSEGGPDWTRTSDPCVISTVL